MKRILALLFLLSLALPLSAELLTKQEIDSDLPSGKFLPREMVVDKIYKILAKVEAIYQEKEAELKADADARFEAWKVAYKAGLEQAEKAARAAGTERDILWIAQTIVGAGLIVYGVYRNDVGTAATGVLMTGAGAVRLIIALE